MQNMLLSFLLQGWMTRNRQTLRWTPLITCSRKRKRRWTTSTNLTTTAPIWAPRRWAWRRAAPVSTKRPARNCAKNEKKKRVADARSVCRFRCGADGGDGLLAAHVQRRRQSSLLPDQNQPGLLHHIPEVRQNSRRPQKHRKIPRAKMSWNIAPVCFQDGPAQ